jgi:hypothetical protein
MPIAGARVVFAAAAGGVFGLPPPSRKPVPTRREILHGAMIVLAPLDCCRTRQLIRVKGKLGYNTVRKLK